MACNIFYKGRKYTEAEFDKLLRNEEFLNELEVSILTDEYLDELIEGNKSPSSILDQFEKDGKIPDGMTKSELYDNIISESARRGKNDVGAPRKVESLTERVDNRAFSKEWFNERYKEIKNPRYGWGKIVYAVDSKLGGGLKAEGDAGKLIIDSNIRRVGEVNATKRKVAQLTKRLNTLVRSLGKAYTPTDERAVSNMLKGGSESGLILKDLPESKRKKVKAELIDIATTFRSIADKLSQQLTELGYLTESGVDIVRENLGNYTTRVYRSKVNPEDWWEEVTTNPELEFIFHEGVSEYKKWFERRLKKAEQRRDKLQAKVDSFQKPATGNRGVRKNEARKRRIKYLDSTVDTLTSIVSDPNHLREAIRQELGGQRVGTTPPKNINSKKTTDKSLLKKRKEIPEPIRKLMGEIDEPALLMELTAARLVEFKSKYEFHQSLVALGEDVLFSTVPTEEFTERIPVSTAPGISETLGTNEIYTNETLRDFLAGDIGLNPKASGSFWIKMAATLSAWSKMNLTVGSPVTQLRNFANAPLFLLRSGNLISRDGHKVLWTLNEDLITRLADSGNETAQAISAVLPGTRPASVQSTRSLKLENLIDLAAKNGVVNSAVALKEIEEIGKKGFKNKVGKYLDRAAKKSIVGKGVKGVWGTVEGTYKLLEDVYGATDDLFKVAAFRGEMERYSRIIHNKSLDKLYNELDQAKKDFKDGKINEQQYQNKVEEFDAVVEVASKIVRDTIPNYRETWEIVNKMNRSLFLGTFISFQAEQLRTQANIINQGYKEVRDGFRTRNKELAIAGATRLIGTSINLGMTAYGATVVSQVIKALYGGDDIDDEANEFLVKEFLPDFIRTASIVKLDEDTYLYTDPGTLLPDNVLTTLGKGKDESTTTQQVLNAMFTLLDPAITKSFSVQQIQAVIDNADANGRKITEAEKGSQEYFQDIVVWLLTQPVTPKLITDTPLTNQGLKDRKDIKTVANLNQQMESALRDGNLDRAKFLNSKIERIKHRISERDKALLQFSFKTGMINMRESGVYKGYEYSSKIRQVTTNLRQNLKQTGGNKQEQKEAYKKAEADYNKVLDDMKSLYRKSWKHLGIDIAPLLSEGRVGSKFIKYIKGGDKPPYEPDIMADYFGKDVYKNNLLK